MPGSERGPDQPSEPRSPRSLAFIVEQEARRVLSESELAPDPARIAQGWQRRFITDVDRVDELAALYRDLGYEVSVDPVRPEELAGECDDCQLVLLRRFHTIYTRKKRDTP